MSARALLAALALAASCGCASTSDDPRDPLESVNRAVYAFNEGFDTAVGKPVARVYREVLPRGVRDMLRNFFANIDDLFIGANNLLQGKPADAVNDWGRFALNTTFGLLGLIDWASDAGMEKHNEDFGQTLGWWGAGDGPYLVLPLFGPSTLRDAGGLVVDWGVDPVTLHEPVNERNAMVATRFAGRRADLLDATRLLEEAALDKYQFLRDAYLQRRRSLVYDGSPPRERPPAE